MGVIGQRMPRRALPTSNTPGLDPALATEYESLRPHVPEAY
jgi:hypothetical protein